MRSESSRLKRCGLACGVAESTDENEARTKAFENARAEFIRVCRSSDDCKGHEAQ